MPAGVLVSDPQLEVLYMNSYARDRIFLLRPGQDTASVMMKRRFYTTARDEFDMGGCMKNMIRQKRRSFHKTLILARREGEVLIFFTASAFRMEGMEYYLFVLVDISAEMDCITHSPGGFGQEDFILGQRIIGRDSRIRDIHRLIGLAADSTVNVMVTGESGTGKELVADAIHALSERRNGPLVKVNCAALSESLLESELFGHVKGSFTGAMRDKVGKFEQAHGGTLFLDEIGEISQSLQVKLLRVIQEKSIERVGANTSIPVDMRLVAATNRDLRQMIAGGDFREDLYYRLNVFSLQMPPLRERLADIPRLCDHFIEKHNENTGRQVKGLSKEAMRLMMRYPWPGNIRELQNAIEHAFVLVHSGLITADDLPETLRHYRPADEALAGNTGHLPRGTFPPYSDASTGPASQPVSRSQWSSSGPGDGSQEKGHPGKTHGHHAPADNASRWEGTGAGISQREMLADHAARQHSAGIRKSRGGRLPIGREQLEAILEQHGWNQSETARVLGISRVALWKKIRKFNLSPPSGQ